MQKEFRLQRRMNMDVNAGKIDFVWQIRHVSVSLAGHFWKQHQGATSNLNQPATNNRHLISWVTEMAALCQPDKSSGATARTPKTGCSAT
jgi:G:T-mismatch repair DNA endonuclease (very short patch repair protein)